MKYLVEPAVIEHIQPMALALDDEEKRALEDAGRPPLYAITNMFHGSEERWTALIDGKPVAMWGVTGSRLETTGEVWLVVAQSIRGQKFAIVRQAMRSLARMFESKAVLTSSTFCGDVRASKFAKALGFKIEREDNINGLPIFRAVMRR